MNLPIPWIWYGSVRGGNPFVKRLIPVVGMTWLVCRKLALFSSANIAYKPVRIIIAVVRYMNRIQPICWAGVRLIQKLALRVCLVVIGAFHNEVDGFVLRWKNQKVVGHRRLWLLHGVGSLA